MIRTRRASIRLAAMSLVAAVAIAGIRAQGSLETMWVWSGAVTTTSAVVKAKVRGRPGDLHLVYGTDGRLQQPQRAPLGAPARPDESGVVTFALEGLAPDTRYHYAVADGDRRTLTGEFQTFASGPMSFAFGAASCAGGNMFSAVSNARIFEVIEKRRPLFFMHMGDFHYTNISRNDVSLFERAYDRVLTQPRQASMYRHVPIVYVWDDHDYGPNDSDGTAPGREAARLAYDRYVPHYPLALQDGQVTTIQQEFTVGRVRFIVTDLRSARDPVGQPDGPDKSTLGQAQREWLSSALARAAQEQVPLVVWVSSVSWITRQGGKDDGWQPYSWERQWIADRIDELGLTRRLVMVAGDAHMTALDDGTNSNYASRAKPGEPGFPVLHAAPLDRSPTVKGGPYSHGLSAKSGQFGWVAVRDDGQEVHVTLSGHDKEGQQLPGLRLELSCRQGTCAVVR